MRSHVSCPGAAEPRPLPWLNRHRLRRPPLPPRPSDTAANYTKYEYKIPVRDGKKLFTVVYVPKEAARDSKQDLSLSDGAHALQLRHPMAWTAMVCAAWRPSEAFLKAGYIFVCQDVRGRYMSEGQVRRDDAPCGEQEEQERHRREQRHARQRAVAARSCEGPQRQAGASGAFPTPASMSRPPSSTRTRPSRPPLRRRRSLTISCVTTAITAVA